jgi:Cytochrome c oxidase subunit IIa family
METKTIATVKRVANPEADFDKNFKPKGAIAFFILLVLLGLVIWYSIYFLMLERI